jgi:6-phosphogluconolactonase
MSSPTWSLHASTEAMALAVSDAVTAVIDAALRTRGHALLAFPGGRTPLPVFDRLVARDIDWSHVTLVTTDERLVDTEHPLSNAAVLTRYFAACGANIVPLVTESNRAPLDAGDDADARLQSLRWPLDLAWLGVGGDGHTASIFPGPDLHAALNAPLPRRAVGVRPDPLPPEAPVARVTLTRGTLCESRRLLLTLTGAHKRRVVEQALAGEPSPSPVGQLLMHAHMPTTIHWSAT